MATKNTKAAASGSNKTKQPIKKAAPKNSTVRKSKASSNKSTKNILILVVLIILAIGGAMLFFNKSDSSTSNSSAATATGKATMSLSSSTSSVAIGDKVHVKLYSDSKDVRNNAVQAVIKYPSDRLQLVKIDSDSSAYPIKAVEKSSEGTVTVSRGVIGGVINKQLVTDMEFVAKSAGNAEISYDKSETFLVSAETNKNILSSGGYETTTVEVIK